MNDGTPPSFSPARRWSISFNVLLSIGAVLALVVMANYLGARHYQRFPWSGRAQSPFSPLTRQVLASVTNQVRVIVFYDKLDPLYDSIWSLLKEYKFANPKIVIESVDYEREPSAALLVKAAYKLNSPTAKNLVIFDCNGKYQIIDQNQLSDLDIMPLATGRSREVRRTHFRGELEFTSALLRVTSARTLKAYFLEGHGEHNPESEEKLMGYSRFAGVLRDNNIQVDRLRLLGTNEVPNDCQLLIIAGPRYPLPPEELARVERYLKQGGRLLVMFTYESVDHSTGLEKLLATWGVAVGNNVVYDPDFSTKDQDIMVFQFVPHALTKPFYESSLHLIRPRSIDKAPNLSKGADSPTVEVLAKTSDNGRVATDIRPGPVYYRHANDYKGRVPLMVVVEQGTIAGVSAQRGSTRIVAIGDSTFWANEMIVSAGNRDFASHTVNWLLARNELLQGLVPQPIKEYKVNLTRLQMRTVGWLLLAGMPGVVLLAGALVWAWRRS